ncbi:MAG: DNA repair protein RadA, partial [Flavobacteriales bacterium]|nr:DNA repair protein RadA [Flavobacteriales bacterium]
AGGVRVEDPAIDLAVIAAVLSSNEDIPIPTGTVFCAEVGLSGEIRPVTRVDQRISEAAKLGFKRIFLSKFNKGIQPTSEIEVVECAKVDEVFRHLFG